MPRVLNFCLLSLLICSCAHNTEARFRSSLTEGHCEEAAKNLPGFKVKKVTEYGLTASSATASYALSGAAYGFDLVYFVIGGITIPTLACMPVGPFITFPFTGSAALYEKCFEYLHRTSDLGTSTFEKTNPWRCPDLSFAVDQLLEVAQCFENRGDLKKAKEQRELILDENAFGGCVNEVYKTKIAQLLEQGN